MSQHRVQHTPKAVYTEYCIIPRSTLSRSQWVFHLLGNLVVLNSLHCDNDEVTSESSLSFRSYCLQVFIPSRPFLASKCSAKLARSSCWNASPILLDHGLQVQLQTGSITRSECIAILAHTQCGEMTELDGREYDDVKGYLAVRNTPNCVDL